MEMNFRSMVYPQPSDVHPPSYMKPFDNGLPHQIGIAAPAIKSPSPHGAVSTVAYPWSITTKQPKEPLGHGWFGGSRLFNGGSIPFKTLDVKTPDSHKLSSLPATTTSKHFLVFDQSGDKTTLVYSSEMSPTQLHFNSLNSSKPLLPPPPPSPFEDNSHNSNKRKSEICNEEVPFCWSPDYLTVNDAVAAGLAQSDSGSEMREDSDEIDALLYSDDDDDEDEEESSDGDGDEDDEVTSTGHSPPSDELDCKDDDEVFSGWFDDQVIAEEVASSFNYPTKRLKTSHGGCNKYVSLSLMESSTTPASKIDGTKPPSSDNEDDAESACGDSNSIDFLDVESNEEGWRKEKIREAVSILQSIVPDGGKKGKGKGAVSVIDEAIDYLRCLKVKAKSLGLS